MKFTDPTKSPAERGVQSAESNESMDWNEETGEYNPYPVNTPAYKEYDEAFMETMDEIREMFPDI